jgi:putative N6-adenine-specific DNA methylase
MGDIRYPCAATASFGLESLVRDELTGMGITVIRTEDRRVLVEAAAAEIARANLCLRTADRVLLQAAEFAAPDFDALYEGVRSARWRDMLGSSPAVTVNARSAKSRLTAVPSIQSVTKKAIVDSLRGRGHGGSTRLEESGPACEVEVELRADRATVSLDTTGPGLHKRGYRRAAGAAPLRETLAAALVILSRWEPPRPFADPLCGSGTIPIEAALLADNAAPGMGRSFAAEAWPFLPAAAWTGERGRARAEARRGAGARILGSDRDPRMVELAGRNARAAGIEDLVRFRAAPLADFRADGDHGCIVCNPPYGERLGDAAQAEALYREMGRLYQSLPTWSFFALSAREDFPRSFGQRASRNRKLYNGNMRCWFYQYFGPLPR